MLGARDGGAWSRLVFLGMVWGGSFIATAFALKGFGPLTLATGRLGLAALALALAARLSGARMPSVATPHGRRVWGFAVAMAMLSNAIPFAVLSWAQQHVPAGVAAIFMAVLPLMVLPLAHVFVAGERMTVRKAAGFLVGVSGTLVLIGPRAAEALGGAGGTLLAEAACLGVVAAYACGSITAKRAPQVDAVAMSAAMSVIATLALIPLALWFERPFAATPAPDALAGLIWLGLLSTALAQVLTLQVLRRAGPSFLSMVNFMIPLWALVFAALLLAETPPARAALALPLILAGVAIARGGRSVVEAP